MQLHRSLFLTALANALVRAQNLTEVSSASTSVASTTSAALTTPSSLGDPRLFSSYPICAQKCSNETIGSGIDFGCDLSETACVCQPRFRARTAACEELTCSPLDYQKTQTLGLQLCAPFYEKNSTLGSAVSSEIATATSGAIAITAGKVPTNPAEYPLCAQACFDKYIPASGCGSLTNRTCICGSKSLDTNLERCELDTCSLTDLKKIAVLADVLCLPVGGQSSAQNSSILSATGSSSNTSTSLPSPSPYTGQAPANVASGFALSVMITVGLLGVVVLGL